MGWLLAVSLTIAGACGSSDGSEGKAVITVSAAASLTGALNELKPAFESANPDVTLLFNFGSSGALQQQIEQGAPVDLYISAAASHMNTLIEKGLVQQGQTVSLLSNALVVVTPKDGREQLEGLEELLLSQVSKVAIGIPDSVPAGAYAKEALTQAGLWDKLQGKTVQAKDVKQVLQYVETGNVDAGFVYKTDALASGGAAIAFEVDPSSYSPIQYPAGIVRDSDDFEETRKLYEFLQSDEAMGVFRQYGFSESK